MLCIKSGLPVDPLERTCRVDIFVRPPWPKLHLFPQGFTKGYNLSTIVIGTMTYKLLAVEFSCGAAAFNVMQALRKGIRD